MDADDAMTANTAHAAAATSDFIIVVLENWWT